MASIWKGLCDSVIFYCSVQLPDKNGYAYNSLRNSSDLYKHLFTREEFIEYNITLNFFKIFLNFSIPSTT